MFNINEFKSIVNLYGGPSKTSLFVVELGQLNSGYISSGDLRFFCTAVDLPGFNLDITSYKPQGFGFTEHIPVGFTPDQLNCTFMLDSDHAITSFFHEWVQKIVNYEGRNEFGEVNGMLPFEQGYKKEYSTTMTVKHYSSDDPNYFYRYTFYDVFPAMISGKSLAWSETESYSTMRINFSYSGFNVDAAIEGVQSNYSNRTYSYLDQLTSIGTYGYKTNDLSRPNSIQDAIDKFSRIRRNLKKLKQAF